METYTPKPGTPKTLIVDMDGTLALRGDRSPYNHEKCADDMPNLPIIEIVRNFYMGAAYIVVIVSGREDKYRPQTVEFLNKHRIPYNALYMRKTSDSRGDAIVKQEIFDALIRDNYNVVFVLDDRDKVVKMWRELGLTCLQVAEGAF